MPLCFLPWQESDAPHMNGLLSQKQAHASSLAVYLGDLTPASVGKSAEPLLQHP